MFVRFLLIASLLQCVTSYKNFQSRIPNGNAVPHPCKPGTVWEGVGHFLAEGTGFRNAFGQDFADAGSEWTVELCRRDSDGDGLTNGQELGDPDCIWKPNAIPSRGEGITHPGICDPWDGTQCIQKPTTHPQFVTQLQWMEDACASDEFVCDGLSDPDLKNVTVRLPPTNVPAKDTTYMCQVFDFFSEGVEEGDYHMIAIQPVIDNTFVLHHIVLFGCTDDVQASSSFECDMVPSQQCQNFLHVWTVGMNGECLHSSTGVRIGTQGYKKVAIQLHWNNVEERADFTDGSGLLIHYTPNRRQNDAAVFLLGSNYFYLPPQQPRVTVESRCTNTCSRQMFTGPVNITRAWNHMHYAGRAMSIEIRRNNEHLKYLTFDQIYSYDSPQVHTFEPEPLEILPGDEFITHCNFTTAGKNRTIFFGDATEDEMCFGFVTFYPSSNVPNTFGCLDEMGMSHCDQATYKSCNTTAFMNPQAPVVRDVTENCRVFAPCLHECIETIVRYMKSEPCMSPGSNVWELLQTHWLPRSSHGLEFVARLSSCKVEVHMAMNPPTSTGNPNNNGGSCDNGNSAPALSHDQTTILFGVVALLAAMTWK